MPVHRRPPPPAGPVRVGPILAVAAMGLFVWLAMFVAGWKSVPVDKIALHYSGGPIEGEHFEKVVPPGSRTQFYGLLENVHFLPATQRSYIMSKDGKQGDTGRAEYVGAPAADGVVTEWESATYFKLNTRPAVVQRFFEQICVKYGCTDLDRGGGWDRMLADTFRQQIVAAIQAEARQHSSQDIYSNPLTFSRMQDAIGSTLKRRVNEVLGGEFFCGPTFRPEERHCPEFAFVVKEIGVPADIRAQYHANRASLLEVDKAKTDAEQQRVRAQGEAESQAALRAAPDLTPAQLEYLRTQAQLECARRPDCVLVVGAASPSVEVSTPARR